MTVEVFRRLALGFPEATEGAHMGHPDFRVQNKIFATLRELETSWVGMIKLTPAQQKRFVKAEPDMFSPVDGGWGRQGATNVHLKPSKKTVVQAALTEAWLNTAPKRLTEEFEAKG